MKVKATMRPVIDLFGYIPETGEIFRKDSTKGFSENRIITRKNDRGYLVTTVNGKSYKVHHIVWEMHGNLPEKELDHIDRNRTNNRIENLRRCSRVQNLANSGPKRGKYKGVSFCKQTGKWVAQIGYQYRNIKIGRFNTPEEAAIAYNKRAAEYFGEFAFQNEIPQ